MNKITDIKPQKKNENRVSIFIDQKFWLGMDKTTLMSISGVAIGQEITEEKKLYIETEAIKDEALGKAINFLNWRMRSQSEVEKKLSDAEYDENTIALVVERLVTIGYIDDANFAEELLRSAAATGHGPKWFSQKAYMAGIDKNIINEVLQTWSDEDQITDALNYANSNRYANLEEKKIFSRLAGRGYDFDTIKKVIESIKDQD